MLAHLTPCPLGLLCRAMTPQEALSRVVGTALLSPGSWDEGPALAPPYACHGHGWSSG